MGPIELTKARIKWFPPAFQTPSVRWEGTVCDQSGPRPADMSDLWTAGQAPERCSGRVKIERPTVWKRDESAE
jgi:hypothetical protein